MSETTYRIKWRKSSATYVIYKGRHVFESGFNTEKEAAEYLAERLQRCACAVFDE